MTPGVWWPAWVWLGGALTIGLWTLIPRLWLAFAARRAGVGDDRERLDALAGRLNLRRPVRVLVSAKLAGPIAFGVLRPGIGLPADFRTAHARAEQDAMLAHELAHHAARDPLWLALADLLLAVLWWHPLVWWARRQFRAASEAAADEASLVVEDGPAVLAGCLVALASRLPRRGILSLLGMAGFRSELGRRVERLLRLRAGEQPVKGRTRPGLFAVFAGFASLGVAEAASVWLFSAQAAARPTLLAVLGEALRLEPDNEAAQHRLTRVREAQRAQPGVRPFQAPAGVTIMDPGRKAIHERLDQIILDQVEFPAPGIPLREVVAFLAEAVNARDAQINFIIAPGIPAGTSTAKSSGSVLSNPAGVRVRLSPPLRKVRLADALAAIVQAAEQPLQYTVESYGIVFSPRDPKTLDSPTEVMIEARFVEVTEDASQEPGLDWLLDKSRAPTNTADHTRPPGSTGSVAALTGIMPDPQFRGAVASLWRGGTNGVRELRGDQLVWPGRDAPNAANIRVSATLGPSRTGILTEPQLREVLRALEHRPGVDVLTAPRITTLSGRQAQIRVADLRTILTGTNPAALREPGPAPGPTNSPFTSAAIPVGPALDVVPQVIADNDGIRLNVLVTVSEFLGYDTPPPGAQVRVWEGGRARWVDPPLPRFRVRQLATETLVPKGQTLVPAGAAVADPPKTPDGQAIQNGAVRHKQLLVFVTPRITDPAGYTRTLK